MPSHSLFRPLYFPSSLPLLSLSFNSAPFLSFSSLTFPFPSATSFLLSHVSFHSSIPIFLPFPSVLPFPYSHFSLFCPFSSLPLLQPSFLPSLPLPSPSNAPFFPQSLTLALPSAQTHSCRFTVSCTFSVLRLPFTSYVQFYIFNFSRSFLIFVSLFRPAHKQSDIKKEE